MIYDEEVEVIIYDESHPDYYAWEAQVKFEEFKGKTLKSFRVDSDEIDFHFTDGTSYQMYHSQSCCEHVSVESIVGDLEDFIGQEILVAEERISSDEVQPFQKPVFTDGDYVSYHESFTWTFYTLRCVKASVDIRWYGSSNGYYSESVSVRRTK
jgi:hypothetical protein